MAADSRRNVAPEGDIRRDGRRGSRGAALQAVGACLLMGSCAGLLRAADPVGPGGRAGASQKGSLVFFPHVEVRWDAAGTVRQDTLLSIVNDYPAEVDVQLYLVNGDAPTAAIVSGSPPVLRERAHPGWNRVDVQLTLTGEQPSFWSAANGAAGIYPMSVLDPGPPMGRPDPDPDNPGGRLIRGYIVGWAVNAAGHEIRWNHLSGSAIILDYARAAAWEYPPWAFQVRSGSQGAETLNCLVVNLDTGQCVATEAVPGRLDLDGREYDSCPERLQFQFSAAGDSIFRIPGTGVPVVTDTYLTLSLISSDLRQDNDGPLTTKAKFDIWNQNEVRFSGTERCITCWDSTLLMEYTGLGAANHFVARHLQTRYGRARVDGLASSVCDSPTVSSSNGALLGVLHRRLRFPNGLFAGSGHTIGGQGEETAQILHDIIQPPQEARVGGN